MQLKSFAKINLSLTVNHKLKKVNLHNIQSNFCLVNLFDTINIKKISNNRDRIKFKGTFSKLIKKKDNSILKTLKILREKKFISGYYSVEIKKRIPVFSGLGGGTSNAASLIQYFLKKRSKKYLDLFKKLLSRYVH